MPPRARAGPAWPFFSSAWWFGFGHFSVGLYWVANALLIEWQRVGWMIPFAVFGLAGVLGVFAGLATLGVRASRARGVAGICALAVAWALGEWLRGHVLTGFPWNLTATMWVESVPMIQGAALFGAYGLSALSVLVCALPATLASADRRLRWLPTLAAVVLLAAGWGAGSYRLAGAGNENVPDVRLRLVQPNVPQALKWDPDAREANLRRIIELTRAPGFETRTHTIWSETATAFPIWGDNEMLARRRMHRSPPRYPAGGMLVTGAPRFERAADGTLRAWNSLHAMDGAGVIHATFDKFHLVPFGEYVPFRDFLPIDRIVPGGIDFSAGLWAAACRDPRPAACQPADLLRGHLPRARCSGRSDGPRCFSTSRTIHGSASRRVPTSISPPPVCARSKRDSHSCVRPAAGSRPSSIPMDGHVRRWRLVKPACSTPTCRGRLSRPRLHILGM